jgi:hypothetical protein
LKTVRETALEALAMDANQQDDGDEHAGGLLVGAPAIKSFLVDDLGWPPSIDVYYLKRTGWPIGSTSADGGRLVATKTRLSRHTQKLASAS